MEYRDKLIRELAERESKRIARSTILRLQKLTDCRLSGDDSPLKNVWEEVCVQMQSQESYDWDAYLETIRPHIAYMVEQLHRPEQEAIWLQTNQGSDWDIDNDEPPESVPVCLDDCVDYILREFVLHAASDWKNTRIEKYLDQGNEMD